MEVDNEGANEGWVAKLIDGGLPQLIAGPAGKAISRLIGVGVEIPAAYLQSIVQGIQDKTEARTIISKAMAEKLKEIAIDDSGIMDRAMSNMLHRSYKTQKNKDAIAAVAIAELEYDPPPSDSEGPSDDWMSRFESYSEDASTDDIRAMFGKILAGEIRAPGSISKSTLHFTSMLDESTAKLIDKVLPLCVDAGVAFLECDPSLLTVEIAYIEQSGFWTSEKVFNLEFDGSGVCIKIIEGDDGAFAIKGTPNAKFMQKVAVLSRAGSDLVKIVDRDFDYQALANSMLGKKEVTNFYYGQAVDDGKVRRLKKPTELFKK